MDEKEKLDRALEAVRNTAQKYEFTEAEVNEALSDAETNLEEEVVDTTEELRNLMIPQTTTEMSVAVINKAYDTLNHAAFNAWDAHCLEVEVQNTINRLKADLKLLETKAILDGSNTGKNDDQRRAFNQETFKEQYTQLAELENELEHAKSEVAVEQLGYDIARWEVERVAKVLQFFEIQTTIGVTSAMEQQAAPKGGILTSRKH